MKSLLHPTGLSIIIPFHNAGAYIEECLDSLTAQKYSDWTAFLADDASDDDGPRKVEPYLKDERFRLLRREKRRHLMGNLHAALQKAKPAATDVVTILDGDDALLPGALERIMAEHAKGYDVVYTDMHVSNGGPSIGRPLSAGIPVRQQSWCLSHLRSFKGYLLEGLGPEHFQDDEGRFLRAAGDLSLYFPIIERAGMHKVSFINEKLHFYRMHEHCNHVVFRDEQLANNRMLRARPALHLQTQYFDVIVRLDAIDPLTLRETAAKLREEYPLPWSILWECTVSEKDTDRSKAYSDLWIAEGVFLRVLSS